jgi:DNA-binding NarL/FixJ family response regulator
MAPVVHEQPRARTTTRIVIVDDHNTFADLLAMALNTEPGFHCVGTASSSDAAVELVRTTQPDIVVMDIQLGAGNGLEATRRITQALPDCVIVVVSALRDSSWAAKAALAGAHAFAPKTGSLDEMLWILHNARVGSMLVAPSLRENGADTQVTSPVTSPGSAGKITSRELDVLILMGRGIAPAEIARRLRISVHTCRGYVRNIHSKLGVRSQLEAVVKAQRLGLITADDDQ